MANVESNIEVVIGASVKPKISITPIPEKKHNHRKMNWSRVIETQSDEGKWKKQQPTSIG